MAVSYVRFRSNPLDGTKESGNHQRIRFEKQHDSSPSATACECYDIEVQKCTNVCLGGQKREAMRKEEGSELITY